MLKKRKRGAPTEKNLGWVHPGEMSWNGVRVS